jgi:uncharacterized protein YdhG (YjbR/CyaY superfamily)
MTERFSTVDAYIASFPPKIKAALEKLRKTIRAAAPAAQEVISYNMPAYKHHGMLVYFAAHTGHAGLYPMPSAIIAFKKELAAYTTAKSTVQFPYDKPIPLDLVTKMVKFRVKENEEKLAAKKPKKAADKPVSASKKLSDDEQVKAWMTKKDTKVKADITAVRKIISAASPELKERIKWNAPSYYYKEDIVTFGPYKNNTILLVFHHPAVVKVKSTLLKGEYKDRRLVSFSGKADAEKNKAELIRIIREIIKAIDKA